MNQKYKLDEAVEGVRAQQDGYANVITRMGMGEDKSNYTFFNSDRYLGYDELSQIYEQDALAARIVSRVVDDATRTKYRLTGVDQEFDVSSIQSELDDLQAIQQLGNAWRWARLYGGSIVVMAIDDGRPYSEPVDFDNVRRLNGLSIVDSPNVIPSGFVPGLGSRAYSEPEYYEIVVPWGGKSTGSSKERIIHKSRCIRFDGISVPASRMILNGGWGPGVLQQVWRQIKRLGSAEASAENLLHELSVMIFKITGFKELLCGGPGSQETAQQLLEQLKWGLDNLHVLGLDKEDDYQEVKRSVDGIESLLNKFESSIVRATEYPRMILLGEHPGGLNSSSAAGSEIRAYYDHVKSEQESKLTPRINRILEILFAARRNAGEAIPEEWVIEYDPLMQDSKETQAQAALQWAQAMQMLIMNGVVSADEARQQLSDQGIIETIDPTPYDVAEAPEQFGSIQTAGDVPNVGE